MNINIITLNDLWNIDIPNHVPLVEPMEIVHHDVLKEQVYVYIFELQLHLLIPKPHKKEYMSKK